jgi:hypothetical protein
MNGLSPRKIRAIFNNPVAATIPPFPGRLLPITFTCICSPSMLNPRSRHACFSPRHDSPPGFFPCEHREYSNKSERVKTDTMVWIHNCPVERLRKAHATESSHLVCLQSVRDPGPSSRPDQVLSWVPSQGERFCCIRLCWRAL